uniref:Uncharacterized protein n=1 Tax=Chlamydomonas euryale TaxID=1486919 RepID=A0A7R9VM08_9CHLO
MGRRAALGTLHLGPVSMSSKQLNKVEHHHHHPRRRCHLLLLHLPCLFPAMALRRNNATGWLGTLETVTDSLLQKQMNLSCMLRWHPLWYHPLQLWYHPQPSRQHLAANL